ncbi:MAG: hypothetical protein F4Y03_00915 [Alphaproteobacteria bacterium]|nr:hypothetical protein [Alphaproteobacteria bacterium]
MPILNSRIEGKNRNGDVIPAPDTLLSLGPVIPVTLTLSDEAQKAYVERGESPPAGVSGFAMIDTGATATCIDIDAANQAGLPTVGAARMTSASHANQNVPTFAGKIVGPPINIDVEAGMGANLSAFGSNLIVLLGRDLLQSAVFIYNGPDGHFSIAI